jgi:delta(3,5)-delta(2,4)-dienoyl-CoA isomerase
VHGACVGAGVELVAACDIRCCSKDATFVLKEVDMAIVADLGALQRLPRIVGYGNAAELALTGRRITVLEAKEMGLVSRVFDSKQELDAGVAKIAKGIQVYIYSNLTVCVHALDSPKLVPNNCTIM